MSLWLEYLCGFVVLAVNLLVGAVAIGNGHVWGWVNCGVACIVLAMMAYLYMGEGEE